MDIPKPGEVVTDGRSINIGAPVIRASASYPAPPPPPPPKLSELTDTMIRHLKGVLSHLKGVLSAAEELRAYLEREESK